MLVFHEIRMENFKKYYHKKEYLFKEGLLGIFGKNESGKSTIGDAISVALFGVSKTGFNKNDIISWGENFTKLKLEFELDKRYKITRTIGKGGNASLEIFDGKTWNIIEKTITAVDKRMEDVLGLDFKSFKNSIFIGQNDLNSLSSLNKKDRQEIINKLSRYNELSTVEKNLKEIIKEMKSKIELLLIECEGLKSEVESKTNKKNELDVLIKNKQSKEEILDAKLNKLDKIKKRIQIFAELEILNSINQKLSDIDNRISENEEQLNLIRTKEIEKRNFEEKVNKYGHVDSNLESNIKEIKKIRNDFKDINSIKKDIEQKKSFINEKKKQIKELENKEYQKSQLNEKISTLSHVSNELKENINQIGNIISERSKLKEKKIELDNIISKIDEMETSISHLNKKEKEKIEYLRELENFQHINPELKEKIDEISNILNDLAENKNNIEIAENNIIHLEKNIEDRELLKNEINSNLLDIQKKNEKMESTQEKLNKLSHITLILKGHVNKIHNLKSEITRNKSNLNQIEKDIKMKNEKLGRINKLKNDSMKYIDYLDLNHEKESNNNNIQETNLKIEEKNKELGNLDLNSKNPQEIENEHEKQLNKANIFVITGIILICAGLGVGLFLNNIFMILIIFGIFPVILGFKDKNKYKILLNQIKDKREDFGYLKELNKSLKKLKMEKEKLESDSKSFEKFDINLLKDHHDTFSQLEAEQSQLENLKDSKNEILDNLNLLSSELKMNYNNLPEHYKSISIEDNELSTKIYNLFLEESKDKSKYENSLKDLHNELNEKSGLQSEFDEKLKQVNSLKSKLENEQIKSEQLTQNKLYLINNLEEEYNTLPSIYKERIDFDDENIYKKLSNIYQEENKIKSNIEIKIQSIDKELIKKEELNNKLHAQKEDKHDLEKFISSNEDESSRKLNKLFDALPSHYLNRDVNNGTFYKTIIDVYNREDKDKSSFNSQIMELNKEIDKKPYLDSEINKLENEKIELEKSFQDFDNLIKIALKDNYDALPNHYKEISIIDPEISIKLNDLYQEEDKFKSNFLTSIEALEKDIENKNIFIQKSKGLRNEKDKLLKEFSNQDEKLKNLIDDENLFYDENLHLSLKEDYEVKNTEIKKINEEIWNIEGNIKPLKEDTNDLEEKLEELRKLKKSISDIKYGMEIHEISKKEIFVTAKLLREQVMDRTTKHMAIFLPKITNNRYKDVKISDDFKVNIYSPEKNDFVGIHSLSGGTKDQILFAFRLAFTNAIIGGRTHTKGFALFLDEFLGSFDNYRRIKTLKMLRSIEEDFKQIFLISHIEGMENDVDQVIKTPEV